MFPVHYPDMTVLEGVAMEDVPSGISEVAWTDPKLAEATATPTSSIN